ARVVVSGGRHDRARPDLRLGADIDAAVSVHLHEAVHRDAIADRHASFDAGSNIDGVLEQTIAADTDVRRVDDPIARAEHAARSGDTEDVAKAERREPDPREPEPLDGISAEAGQRF